MLSVLRFSPRTVTSSATYFCRQLTCSHKVVAMESWTPPQSVKAPSLKINNSLSHSKVEFTPMCGNRVSAYICGPTVYDSAHLGHARAYLSFDVIRRILEDYFGYDVFWVMNVTDIDDKIILKARRNYLFSEYMKENAATPINAIWDQVQKASEASIAKQLNHVKSLEAAAVQDAEQLEQQRKKLEMLESTYKTAQSAFDGGSRDDLLAIAKDQIAEALDAEKGSTIRDNDIFRAHAAKYETEFMEDMEALGIRPPSAMTRVSEYIPEIISYIEKIIENGFGYESNGSVYFNTVDFAKSHVYCKLQPSAAGSTGLLAEAEGALSAGTESEKRCQNDFALWKKSKPGEPEWDSPWGKGRPGWHIECSAMASDLLGKQFDIHCGGEDLRFPHHDNELAQAEAHYGHQQWVNYFLHAGHLHIDGCKMSKSLKNFISIRQMLNPEERLHCTPRRLRLLFLNQLWDHRINYSPSALDEIKKKEKAFQEFFLSVKTLLRDAGADKQGFVGGTASLHAWSDAEKRLHGRLQDCQDNVRAALCDNFNTVKALQCLLSLVSDANSVVSALRLSNKKPSGASILVIHQVARYVTKILRMFGVIQGGLADDIGFADEAAAGSGGDRTETVAPFLNAYCGFRDTVREWARCAMKGCNEGKIPPMKEMLELCDKQRDSVMVDVGVRVEDAGARSSWMLVDREELLRERQEAARQQNEMRIKKLETTLLDRKKKVETWEKCLIAPDALFRNDEKYASFKFDDANIPSHNAEGEELSKKMRKNLEKLYATQKKNYQKYQDAVAKDGDPIAQLNAEIQKLTEDLTKLRMSR
eukprot:Rmarinus@m.2364